MRHCAGTHLHHHLSRSRKTGWTHATRRVSGPDGGRRRLVVAVFLNKVYHNLTGKLSLLSRLESAGGGNVSIATFSWSPIVGQRPAQGKMSFHFMPFATNAVVHNAVARADKYDLYWSGDTNQTSTHYGRCWWATWWLSSSGTHCESTHQASTCQTHHTLPHLRRVDSCSAPRCESGTLSARDTLR